MTTVQRLAAAGIPADLPAALARAASAQQQQQQQPLSVAPSPLLAQPPMQQGPPASPMTGALLDAGRAGAGQPVAVGMSNALRFAAQYPPYVLGQMNAPPRPLSAPLPPSMAGLRAADAMRAHPLARANLSGQLDAQQLLAAQAQLGTAPGSPFQVRLRFAKAFEHCTVQ